MTAPDLRQQQHEQHGTSVCIYFPSEVPWATVDAFVDRAFNDAYEAETTVDVFVVTKTGDVTRQ